MNTKRVLDEALGLPQEERITLAKKLLVSLEEPSEHDASRDELWAKEIDDRLQMHKENPEHAISKDDALSELHAVVRGEST